MASTEVGRRELGRSELSRRLSLAFDWYQGMVSAGTGRLVYLYHPETERLKVGGSAIRDIASVWDVARLSSFLDRAELRPLMRRSLEHYLGFLEDRDGALVLDSSELGEPAAISHSAFLLLALIDAPAELAIAERARAVVGLTEGLLRQQRPDGSYAVYFDGEPDDGLEFYLGEVLLALMRVHAVSGDQRCLASVERGFAFCRDRFGAGAAVAEPLLVFYANWQSQYAELLHQRTADEGLRAQVRDHVFALHDRVIAGGFYQEVERAPARQATVEVACGLEGLSSAFAIARREGDGERVQRYRRCIEVALSWLLGAQRLLGCTVREHGGFGHSLTDRTQRVDVTGHAVGGLIASLHDGVAV